MYGSWPLSITAPAVVRLIKPPQPGCRLIRAISYGKPNAGWHWAMRSTPTPVRSTKPPNKAPRVWPTAVQASIPPRCKAPSMRRKPQSTIWCPPMQRWPRCWANSASACKIAQSCSVLCRTKSYKKIPARNWPPRTIAKPACVCMPIPMPKPKPSQASKSSHRCTTGSANA